MAFKKGNVPWNIGKKGGIGTFKGHTHSNEAKQKMREARLKNPTRYWKGKKRTLPYSWKENVGKSLRGKYVGELSPNWKGGSKASHRRQKAKRKKLGYAELNEPFEGCEGHHIDRDHIVFIPKWLHKSIHHSLNNLKSMEQINLCVFYWILNKGDDK